MSTTLIISNIDDILDPNNPDKLGCPFISGNFNSSKDSNNNLIYNYTYRSCSKFNCRKWDDQLQECIFVLKKNAIKHYHNRHLHRSSHSCSNGFLLDCSLGSTSVSSVLKSSVLIAESAGNEDLDNNNLIFCYDFIIDPSDPMIPPVLLLEQSKRQLTTITMTWQEFLDTL